MKESQDSLIGRDLYRFDVLIERGRLKLFAKAIGETNEIFFDLDAARGAGYRDIVAPPTFIFCLSEEVPDPNLAPRLFGLDLNNLLHAEQEIEHFSTICAGDKLIGKSSIADFFEKKNGELKFVVTLTEFTDNQGSKVANVKTTCISRSSVS